MLEEAWGTNFIGGQCVTKGGTQFLEGIGVRGACALAKLRHKAFWGDLATGWGWRRDQS